MTDYMDRVVAEIKVEADEDVKRALLGALNETSTMMSPPGDEQWTSQDAAYFRTRAVAFEGLYREQRQP